MSGTREAISLEPLLPLRYIRRLEFLPYYLVKKKKGKEKAHLTEFGTADALLVVR